MTCKDCVHYQVCEDVRYGDIADCPINRCGGFFKNKADFVEVVRCEECKYRKTHTCAITGTKTLFCDYGVKPVVVEPTHYCGYGERSDT